MTIWVERIEWGFYKIGGKGGSIYLSFRYDSKRHKYIVDFDFQGEEMEFTEKKGEAVLKFLDWLATLTVEESFDSQGA